MRNSTLFILFAAILATACSKDDPEDRIAGAWKIESAWREKLAGREYFQTGYESGYFSFQKDGDAKFIEGIDTLEGRWNSETRNTTYFNAGTGQYEKKEMKYFKIRIADPSAIRVIEIEFHDFRFLDNWNKIRADQYSLSEHKIYDFVRP